MGLGKLLNRNLVYDVTNTDTGASDSYEIVTGKGLIPNFPTSSYRGGMGIPGAYRSATLISDLIGGLPWHAYRARAGVLTQLDPNPPLLEQPYPAEERVDTFSSWALDLLWHGNAVALVAARDRQGWPTSVLPVSADIVSVDRVGPGANANNLPVGSIQYDVGGKPFSPRDVIHIKGPHSPGDLRGMGVLELHLAETLDLAREQGRQARTVSKHGVPTGVLKDNDPDATEDDLRKIKQGWLKSQRDRTVAVVNSATDFTPLSWNPQELELVEARKFALHEIALIFGLPLYFLGADQSSRTYSNVESEGLNLLKYSLGGHLARFEQTLSSAFPRGTRVKANLDALLRPDTKTRYETYQIGIANNFLLPDEARELEDRPPLGNRPVVEQTDTGEVTDA